nr:hypothetical transcript [Hymenolepis microstoma]
MAHLKRHHILRLIPTLILILTQLTTHLTFATGCIPTPHTHHYNQLLHINAHITTPTYPSSSTSSVIASTALPTNSLPLSEEETHLPSSIINIIKTIQHTSGIATRKHTLPKLSQDILPTVAPRTPSQSSLEG